MKESVMIKWLEPYKDKITLSAFVAVVTLLLVFIIIGLTDITRSQQQFDCAGLALKHYEQDTKWTDEYGCLVKRGDHWERSQW
jgi:hypothetical protein